MSSKGIFKHSTPVPRIYKIASKVAKNAKSGKDSLKNLVYQEKHVNIKTVYALVVETFKRDAIIEELLEKSELLIKEPRFDPWLAKILICEMLWGKNKMKGDSKPLQTILGYEELLKKLIQDCTDIKKDVLKHNVLKPRYVRVNTLKVSIEEAINNFRDEGWTLVKFFNCFDYEGFLERLNNLEPNEFMIDLHIPELLIFPPKTEFHYHKAYKSRSIILQDKASCLPVFLLNPNPGSIVIDMCAAPGMKTTQLAAMLQNSGTLHAIELDTNREKILREFVEASGATCVKTILKDVMQINDTDCPGVEYVLVDPSCTGSGITDRVEIDDSHFHEKMDRLKKLCNFQAKLLRHATTAFPQAKRIVYSTCSMNAEENEDIVRQILETCQNFKLVDAKKLLKSWNDSSSEVFPTLGKMCVYATPEKDKTNGFFIAVLERLKEGEINPYLNVELCKLFKLKKDRRVRNSNKKTKEETFSQQFDESNSVLSAKEETRSLQKNNKKFKQESEIKNKEPINMMKEYVEPGNVINSDGQCDRRKRKIDDNDNTYNIMKVNNIDEPVPNIKIKRNKSKKHILENISEQLVETELNEDLDDVIINENMKKKKRNKIKCEETTEALELIHPEGNKRKKKKETESYDENAINEFSKTNVHENLTRNKNKMKEEKSHRVNSENNGQRNKENSKKENELSVENSISNSKKDKKKNRKDKELISKNENENSVRVSISNEGNLKKNKDIEVLNLCTDINFKKSKKRKIEKLENQGENDGIDKTNSNLIENSKNKKKQNQYDKSVNAIQNLETAMDDSAIQQNNSVKKRKKKKHSAELLIENESSELTIENCENNDFKKNKKNKKQEEIPCNNDKEKIRRDF